MENNFNLNNLKVIRELKNYTQTKVSVHMEVSQETISSWEVGRTMPTIPNLVKLADYYNCSIDYLLGRTDVTTPIDTLTLDKNNLEYANIIELYKSLSKESKQHLMSYLKYLNSKTSE